MYVYLYFDKAGSSFPTRHHGQESMMPHLWTMDAFLSQESLQSHGEGDICAAPEEGDISHWEKWGEQSYQGVEALDKPCLGFSVCTWYQEQASQPTQRAAEDGCGAISILIRNPS